MTYEIKLDRSMQFKFNPDSKTILESFCLPDESIVDYIFRISEFLLKKSREFSTFDITSVLVSSVEDGSLSDSDLLTLATLGLGGVYRDFKTIRTGAINENTDGL